MFLFDSDKLAFLKEKEVLTTCLPDKLCLNLAEGGKGGANFLGKTHTEVTKQKIKEAAQHRPPFSPTAIKKIIDSNKSRVISNEFRDKMRKISTNRVKSDIEKQKISNALKGRKHSAETKIKMREKALQRYASNK